MIELIRINDFSESAREMLSAANQSPFINHISEQTFQRLMNEGSLRFLVDGNEWLGFSGWTPINEQWIELGPFFVLPDFQGQGLGKRLVEETIKLTREQYALYAITVNPAMAALLEKYGLTRKSLLQLPPAIWLYLFGKLRIGHLQQALSSDGDLRVMHFVSI